jgi:hypothetical protein
MKKGLRNHRTATKGGVLFSTLNMSYCSRLGSILYFGIKCEQKSYFCVFNVFVAYFYAIQNIITNLLKITQNYPVSKMQNVQNTPKRAKQTKYTLCCRHACSISKTYTLPRLLIERRARADLADVDVMASASAR